MSTIHARIKEQRLKMGYTLAQIADMLNVKEATVQRYESGEIKNLKHDTIVNLANILKCSPAYLMGWTDNTSKDNDTQKIKGVKIPVIGTVAAGIPIEAIENIIDYEEIPKEMAQSSEYFALKIKGDSMAPRILNGDVVIVKKQSDVDSGDIAIVLINGDEATVKCLKKQDDGIILTAYNIDVWEPKYYSRKDIQNLPITVLGKVVELRGKF